jgi:multiple sugar transport system substrate-binding protein
VETNPGSGTGYRLWATLIAQQGGSLVQGGKLAYGTAGTEALKAMADWFAKGYGKKSLDYPAANTEFFSGQAAFMINGVWEVPTLVDLSASNKLSFDYGVVPLPKLYANQSVWGDSHAFAVPNNKGKPVSAEHLKAALKFVNYVDSHAIVWAGGGHIPAYMPVTETESFKKLKPNADFASVVSRNVVFSQDGWYSGAAGPLEAVIGKFVPAAMAGQLPVEDALQKLDIEANKLMASGSPK